MAPPKGTPSKGKAKATAATTKESRAAAAQNRPWAKASDWEEYRERITDLYRTQGLHLDEVMAIMSRDYAFHANHRMYKTRIKKWGIDKNQKATEVALMLRLKREREAQGKASEFIVRGRLVDWAKIQAYLRREPLLVRKLQAAADGEGMEVVLGSAAAGIICRTPSPDPAELVVPKSPVREKREMRLPEEIAVLTRDYFLGALERGVWRRVGADTPVLEGEKGGGGGGGGEDIRPSQGVMYLPRRATAGADLENWSHRVRRARHMVLTPGGVDEGFKRLGECLDETRGLFADEDPLLLYNMLGHTLGLTPNGRDLGAALCRHFRELSEIVLGEGHPIPAIFARFEALVNTDIHYENIGLPVKLLVDLFEEREGGAGEGVMELYHRLVWLLGQEPAMQARPPDGGEGIKEVVDRFQAMRSTGGSWRFCWAYMSHVRGLAAKVRSGGSSAGSSPSSDGGNSAGSGGGEENNVIKFRDSKHFLIFNIEGAKPSEFEGIKEEEDYGDGEEVKPWFGQEGAYSGWRALRAEKAANFTQ